MVRVLVEGGRACDGDLPEIDTGNSTRLVCDGQDNKTRCVMGLEGKSVVGSEREKSLEKVGADRPPSLLFPK